MNAWLFCALLAAQGPRPLHEFQVDTHGLDARTAGGMRLQLDPAAALPEQARRAGTLLDKDHQWTVKWPVPDARDVPLPSHTQASFLVDFDQPSVMTLVEQTRKAHGQSPTVEQLVGVVSQHINNKNGLRGLDVASTVARLREGDCTEHAVLLVAVLRAFGRPARMVVGLAVALLGNKQVGVFGHAWAEVFDGSAWRVADAALYQEPNTIHHVPMVVVVNEGMGFRGALLAASDPTSIRRISLVK